MTVPQEIDCAPPPAGLREWLDERGLGSVQIEPLIGDVSLRRYVRLRLDDGATQIVAQYPPELRLAFDRFLRTTDLLARQSVRTPEILEHDRDNGFMILEDAGPKSLFEMPFDWSQRRSYLLRGHLLIERIRDLPTVEVGRVNPPLGLELLRSELEQTWNLFLRPHRLLGDPSLAGRLRDGLGELVRRLAADELVPCHRDFMARNLFPCDDGDLMVLDHQDLRLGPPAYDLASLLNDSLYAPRDLEEELLESAVVGSSGRLAYHRAAAQRTLKIVGTFTRFAQAGCERYVDLIPVTLERSLQHLSRLPETEGLVEELTPLWSGLGEAGRGVPSSPLKGGLRGSG